MCDDLTTQTPYKAIPLLDLKEQGRTSLRRFPKSGDSAAPSSSDSEIYPSFVRIDFDSALAWELALQVFLLCRPRSTIRFAFLRLLSYGYTSNIDSTGGNGF